MTITDINILAKKILVGILLFAIPLAIIAGSLYLVKLLFTK